jgi:hypothetical protein
MRRLGKASLLKRRKLWRARLQVDAVVGDRRSPAFQRVLATHGLAEERSGGADVSRQTAGVVGLQRRELCKQLRLVRVPLARWRPRLEEVSLSELAREPDGEAAVLVRAVGWQQGVDHAPPKER